MPPFDPVHVTIFILQENNKFTVLGAGEQGPFRISIDQTPGDIENLNILLQDAIQRVASTSGNSTAYEGALRELARQGYYVFDSLFASDADKNVIRAALGQSVGKCVQIVSDNLFVPWDLLYDGPLGAATTIDGYWGTKYSISRIILQDKRPGEHASRYIETPPKVGLVTSDRLPYVLTHEIPALEKLKSRQKIALTQLQELTETSHEDALLELGRFLGQGWDILHFACHAYEQTPIERSYLFITKDFRVSMIDFRVSKFELSQHPFVILNACRTSVVNPRYTSSWVRRLWEHGARGVLATDFKVPDDFAATFSAALYAELLKGVSIGKALLNCRRHFWKKESNPLGLAYALYSSPSIKVTKPQKV